MNNYDLGKYFAPKLSCDISVNEYTEEWTVDIGIGILYYQSDPCQSKTDALQEALGYLEGIEVQIKAKIEAIKKELEEQ